MTVESAVVLGLIEGVTEFLPISSTGHLMLASSLLRLDPTPFLTSFEIAIQCGAILSVVILFWRRFLDIEMLKRLFVAFIPTAVIGFALYAFAKTYLLTHDVVVVWALIGGGIILIGFEYFFATGSHSRTDIRYGDAFKIGVCQSIAIIPGVSRSAATIIGGLSLGLSRETIVEFSFLLAVPTMAAATGLDLLKSAHAFTGQELMMLAVGCLVSCLTAMIAIRFLLGYIRQHTFVAFGVYRILIGLVFLLFVL